MNGRWTEEAPGVKAGKDITRGAEEDGKTQSEVIGRITWGGEDFTRHTKVLIANLDEDLGFEELGLETRY